jgi:hypothetical protein
MRPCAAAAAAAAIFLVPRAALRRAALCNRHPLVADARGTDLRNLGPAERI